MNTTLRRALGRFPTPRFLGVMLASALLASGCSGGASEADRNPQPSTVATEAAAESPSVEELLDQIVLAETDSTTGTEFHGSFDGVSAATQPVRDSAPEVQSAVQEGWVDGFSREFWTPEFIEAVEQGTVDEFAKNFDRSGNWMVVSWASAYEDAEAASAALEIQFLSESVLLAGLGGVGGALLGGLVTAGFAASRDWPFALPVWVLGLAASLTVLVGAIAGAYPAARAARLSPTAALATV